MYENSGEPGEALRDATPESRLMPGVGEAGDDRNEAQVRY